MTASPALTSDLQKQVLLLEDDLRARLAADPEREGQWKQEHHRAVENERTDSSWVTWRDDRITQVAVAWVLTTVFIRFCEDNSLLDPVWITGPGSRRQEALDAQLAFFREHPEGTDREWLLNAVKYLNDLPATKSLVESHSALHLLAPSGDAAGKLLEFWRRRSDDGTLVNDLADPSLSTRFLGDLYQDLSQYAKDTFALRQTPVFVEEFILDRTLEPALAELPLDGFKMIDPACGSGHFLLGAFDRLLDRWHRHAPDLETQARVQVALDAIHGVDLNPFAVAIARFRLTLAALRACGLALLERAPAFIFHLAAGDALIHGPEPHVLPGMADRLAFMPFTYATEDRDLLLTLLEEGRYDVVVGNPPYIKVKDRALNKIYRSKYSDVCKGSYALTVPFMKLFYALAKDGPVSGWTGQITSNSFMKREFGAKMIENFLAYRDMRLVVNTSGASIPGHGTPTVILVGRNQNPVDSMVRVILSIRGESGRSDNAGKGYVWRAITGHVDHPGWNDEWISVVDLKRSDLAAHPWNLAGGGALDLIDLICKNSPSILKDHGVTIGRTTHTGSDECFYRPRLFFARHGLLAEAIPVVLGEDIRDYALDSPNWTFFPYAEDGTPHVPGPAFFKAVWPVRTIMASRVDYQQTLAQRRLRWFDHSMFFAKRFRIPLSIAYAFKASHNHFVLDSGGKVFKQTAPVIKLASDATTDQHLKLLGVLNSSTVCFWLRSMAQHQGGGAAEHPWSWTFEFSGGIVERVPLPAGVPLERARRLDSLAKALRETEPSSIATSGIPSPELLSTARTTSERLRSQMIAQQEELDWEVYRLYGLIDEDLTYQGDDLPEVALGQRAFEIVLARTGRDDGWFSKHRSMPVTEIPSHWPIEYQTIVQKRLDLMARVSFIRLLETPEYKRSWEQDPWEKRQEWALREWLLEQLEDRRFWLDPQGRPQPRSIGQLADEIGHDAGFTAVLALWERRPDVPVSQSLLRLLAKEAVPFLAAYRYKEPGLRKRAAWERTWALQRRQDAGEDPGEIDEPPEFASADFVQTSYWAARGKLDVPKERFILYPDAGRETDPTPLLGWAGWDHAQQSLARALIISEREKDGWADERLVPLVAGLAELQPWVDQWHSEIDPAYGVSPAAFCREQLTARAVQVGKTLDQLAAWRPVATSRGRGRTASARAKEVQP